MFDPLDELEAAIDKLGASEAPVDVLRLTKLSERLEYQRLRAVAAFDRSGAWLDVGCLSAASYLRHRGRMTHGNAGRVGEPGDAGSRHSPRLCMHSRPVRSTGTTRARWPMPARASARLRCTRSKHH